MFMNFYKCPSCGHEWENAWQAARCGDYCPACEATDVEPYESEELERAETHDARSVAQGCVDGPAGHGRGLLANRRTLIASGGQAPLNGAKLDEPRT